MDVVRGFGAPLPLTPLWQTSAFVVQESKDQTENTVTNKDTGAQKGSVVKKDTKPNLKPTQTRQPKPSPKEKVTNPRVKKFRTEDLPWS